MKTRSDELFERVNEGSLRLDPGAGSFRLTGFSWRDAPRLACGVAGALILLTGIRLASAALFAEHLLDDPDAGAVEREMLDVTREAVANSDALLEAIRVDDQESIRRCREKTEECEARLGRLREREALRMAERAVAEQALRRRQVATGAASIAGGLGLLALSRGRAGGSRRAGADPTDVADPP